MVEKWIREDRMWGEGQIMYILTALLRSMDIILWAIGFKWEGRRACHDDTFSSGGTFGSSGEEGLCKWEEARRCELRPPQRRSLQVAPLVWVLRIGWSGGSRVLTLVDPHI